MGSYAKIDGTVVIQVVVMSDYSDASLAWLKSNLGGEWVACRDGDLETMANVGWVYDAENGTFQPPRPWLSWVWNEKDYVWESPVPYPAEETDVDGNLIWYTWDEDAGDWVAVPE